MEPFIGQVRAYGFNFPPRGWAFCNGQLLPIAQNQALFALLGTTYGGNGQTTFALPNLQGRFAVHPGTAAGGGTTSLGEAGGEERHRLTLAEMPQHSHQLVAKSAGTQSSPAGALLASPGKPAFGSSPSTTLRTDTLGSAGGAEPHENRPPFTVLNYCIALVGIFPPRD